MDVLSEINRIISARNSAFSAVEEFGISVPSDATISELPSLIREIDTDSLEEQIIDRTISGTYQNSEMTFVRSQAFKTCSQLTSVSLPQCSFVGGSAFASCTKLATANFEQCLSIHQYAFELCSKLKNVSIPNCSYIGAEAFHNCSYIQSFSAQNCLAIYSSAFDGCRSLTSISFPACQSIYFRAFYLCTQLSRASFPKCNLIQSLAFESCSSFKTLYLTGTTVVSLASSNAFKDTELLRNGAGRIYVRSSLVSNYKRATNWAYFSSKISSFTS